MWSSDCGTNDADNDDADAELAHPDAPSSDQPCDERGRGRHQERAWWDQALFELSQRTPPSSPGGDSRPLLRADGGCLELLGQDTRSEPIGEREESEESQPGRVERPWWDQALLDHPFDRGSTLTPTLGPSTPEQRTPLVSRLTPPPIFECGDQELVTDEVLAKLDSGRSGSSFHEPSSETVWCPRHSGLITPPPSPPGQEPLPLPRPWTESLPPRPETIPRSEVNSTSELSPASHDKERRAQAAEVVTTRRFFQLVSIEGGLLKNASAIALIVNPEAGIQGASVSLNSMKKGVRARSPETRTRDTEEGRLFQDILSATASQPIPLLAHAVYTTNLASSSQAIRLASVESLLEEALKAKAYGIQLLIFHLGSFSPTTTERFKVRRLRFRLARDIRSILETVPGVALAIETMTGRCRNETCASFEDIRKILRRVNRPGRLGVCVDLCHVHSAQFDLRSAGGREGLYNAIERLGSWNVMAFHVSDCGAASGSGKDVHVALGNGTIGLNAFRELLRDPRLPDVPFVLETPRYFRHNHPRGHGDTLSRRTERVELELQELELQLLRTAVAMDNDDWDKSKREVVEVYKKKRTALQGKITRMWDREQHRKAYLKLRSDREKAGVVARKVMRLKRLRAQQSSES